MAFVFEVPEVGEGVIEVEVAEWKIAVGDTVEVDQALCEITTDKASMDIPSPRRGVVTKLYGEPGDVLKVHTPLIEMDLLEAGAPAPKKAAAPVKEAAPAPAPVKEAAPVKAAKPAPAPRPPAGPVSDPASRATTKATPAVRRKARELGVNLQEVPGSGPKGRITHADVEAFASRATPAAKAPVAMPQITPEGDEERVKIRGVRRKIAERMQQAKQTAPHFTYVEEIDCTKMVEVRGTLKARAAERGVKLTYIPFIAKAVSVAMRQFPTVNAVMDEANSELVIKRSHHFGIACDTPNGLMVPVLRNVQDLSILEIAEQMQALTQRTREGKASRADLSGSTFTLTSVGNIGGVLATPILNVPEVGILGINQIRKRAVVMPDDSIAVRHMMYLSPSFDHRIIDGAIAAKFIRVVKDLLETPEALLLELS